MPANPDFLIDDHGVNIPALKYEINVFNALLRLKWII